MNRDQHKQSPIPKPWRAPQPLVTELFRQFLKYWANGVCAGGQTGRKAGATPSLAQEASYILFSPPQAEYLQRSPAEVVGAGRRRKWGLKGNNMQITLAC